MKTRYIRHVEGANALIQTNYKDKTVFEAVIYSDDWDRIEEDVGIWRVKS